jgi:hypothetical protein
MISDIYLRSDGVDKAGKEAAFWRDGKVEDRPVLGVPGENWVAVW